MRPDRRPQQGAGHTSAGAIILTTVGGTFALIVLTSIIGARRGSRQSGVADDLSIERGRAEGFIESQRHHDGGAFH